MVCNKLRNSKTKKIIENPIKSDQKFPCVYHVNAFTRRMFHPALQASRAHFSDQLLREEDGDRRWRRLEDGKGWGFRWKGRVFMGFSHLQNQMVDFTYRYVSCVQTHKVIECQIECQIERQLEFQNICQISCKIEFQNICQLQCQTECQIARIHVRSQRVGLSRRKQSMGLLPHFLLKLTSWSGSNHEVICFSYITCTM